MKPYIIEFLLYTALALSAEDIFTGIADVFRSLNNDEKFNWNLPCRSSLWSIPVYALSATLAFNVMQAYWPSFFDCPWWERGLFYMVGTYGFEFTWGLILEETIGECPWRYRTSSWRIWRYINPEYVSLWFFFGFALEWIHVWVLPRML